MTAMQSTNGKPQFGPWLIEQVESGQYEGLCMIGNDIFRIPWKHNARRDLGDEDVKIFKEWAVVSGKISVHPNDKAKWKTNFRCALYSLKNFEMLEDHSKDPDDQHKIYRIIRPQNHQEIHSVQPADFQQPFIDEVYNYMSQDMEETHVMHTFKEDFYGQILSVAMVGYIRPERGFTSLDELIAAIHNDIEEAKKKLDLVEHLNLKEDNFFKTSVSTTANQILNSPRL